MASRFARCASEETCTAEVRTGIATWSCGAPGPAHPTCASGPIMECQTTAMNTRPLSAVVLAAGEGTRMRSERPKPLHRLCGRPMILHVLDALAELRVDKVVVVVGHRGEWVTKTLTDHAPPALSIEFVEQPEQLGTADALAVGLTSLPDTEFDGEGDVVVLSGDAPLVRPPTLATLVRHHRAADAAATLLTARVPDPSG